MIILKNVWKMFEKKTTKVTFIIQQVKVVSFIMFYNCIFEKALFRVVAVLRWMVDIGIIL